MKSRKKPSNHLLKHYKIIWIIAFGPSFICNKMDECEMLKTDWGLLYNLSEIRIKGPKNFSYTENFAWYKFYWINHIRMTKRCTKRCAEILEIWENFKIPQENIQSVIFSKVVHCFLAPSTYKNANLRLKIYLKRLHWTTMQVQNL